MTSLPAWRERGACRGMDQDIFFPARPRGIQTITVRARLRAVDEQAKAVCAECPVLEECRDWAFTRPETIGTWGGLTDIERRVIQGRSVQRFPFTRQATA